MGKAAEILRLAADKIEAGVWTQRSGGRDCLCANVAIIKAAADIFGGNESDARRSRFKFTDDAQVALARHLKMSKEFVESQIIAWNDRRNQTKENVVLALRAAAEKEEARVA